MRMYGRVRGYHIIIILAGIGKAHPDAVNDLVGRYYVPIPVHHIPGKSCGIISCSRQVSGLARSIIGSSDHLQAESAITYSSYILSFLFNGHEVAAVLEIMCPAAGIGKFLVGQKGIAGGGQQIYTL